MKMVNGKPYYTTEEVAKILKMTPEEVDRIATEHNIKGNPKFSITAEA